MQTNQNAFNQSLYDTARHYAGQSTVLSEKDAIDERQREYIAKQKNTVTPYQPGTVIEYTPQEPKPYANDGEALKELSVSMAKLGVVAIGGTAIVGGAVWVWNALTATSVVVAAAPVAATGIGWATIGWGIFSVIALISFFSGRRSSEPKRSNAVPMGGNTSQNINVVVNVAGNSVTTTTNGK